MPLSRQLSGYGEVLSRLLSGYGEDLSQRLSGYGEVGSLQSLACLAIENLVRKSLDQVDIFMMLMMPMMIMMLMLPMMMNHWWYRCWNVCWSLWYHPYHVVHPDHLTTWPPRLPRPFPIPVLESCDGRRKTHSLKPSEYVGEAVLPIYIAYCLRMKTRSMTSTAVNCFFCKVNSPKREYCFARYILLLI